MIANKQDFTEATLFECMALDRAIPLIGEQCMYSLDLRFPKPEGREIESIVLRTSQGIKSETDLVLSLLPLFFGAAWKILDLLVELVSNLARDEPKDNWRIIEKVKFAKDGQGDKSILTNDAALWRAVLAVFAATSEHRHCLVHRTAQFTNPLVQLAGVNKSGAALTPLTGTELVAFIAVAQAVAIAVNAGGLDERAADFLRSDLNQLQAHTGVPKLGGVQRSKPVRLLLNAQLFGPDSFKVNFEEAQQRAEIAHPSAHYEALIYLPDNSGRTLFAQMEEVPKETVNFSLCALPKYLVLR